MEALWDISYSTTIPAFLFLYFALNYFLRKITVGDYDQKYVLITGCDSGFGKLLATKLDSMGFNVFAGCLTEEGVLDLKDSSSGNLKPIKLDITKAEDIDRVEEFIKDELPINTGLWALVNNAGITGPMVFPDCISREDFRKVLDVNLFGTINMTHTFLPLLRMAKGRIVNVGSMLGRSSVRLCVPYCISKHGIKSYTDGLRCAIKSQNVSVHLLEPGGFATNMVRVDHMLASSYKAFDEAPKSIQNYYGKECLEDFLWSVRAMKIADPNLWKVVNCQVHAITARFPQYYYTAGFEARFIFPILRNLPTWISDKLFTMEGVPPIGVSKQKNN